MDVIDKKYLTVGEAQAYFGCSRGFVYNLIKNKSLSVYKVGRRTYFLTKELESLFKKDRP
jgi:excisionase family DNA binding protein